MAARTYAALAAAALASVLLAGCATSGAGRLPAAANTADAACAPSPAAGGNAELHGRLSVKYTQNGEPKSATVNYNWRQSGACTDVALSTPIGSTVATISVTPSEAVLNDGKNPPRRAPDIDTLSAQMLGWSLPVSGLRDWMQGQATAADGKRFAATPQNSEVTTNDGWRVSFVSWQEGATPPKPRRIDAERSATGLVEEMSLRIIIDNE